jgi:hypothetical protein
LSLSCGMSVFGLTSCSFSVPERRLAYISLHLKFYFHMGSKRDRNSSHVEEYVINIYLKLVLNVYLKLSIAILFWLAVSIPPKM